MSSRDPAGEVEAVAAGVGRTRILFCPAVPDAGRLVEKGVLKEAGRETILPRLSVALDVSCPDVRNMKELRLVARTFSPGTSIAVGARGLAANLAEALAPGGRARDDAGASLRPPICFVIGTNDPITLAQLQGLRHATDIEELRFPDDGASILSPSRHVILRLAVNSAAESEQRLPEFTEWAGPAVAKAGTVVVSGGNTLRSLADVMGWVALTPLRTLGQGLVLASPLAGGGPLVVSKSGGHGHPMALSRLPAQAVPKAET